MITATIRGIPYARHKSRGDLMAPKRWTEAVVQQTAHLPVVSEACILKVTFFLPADKFPRDFPYGPDLDNLLKRTLDALQCTVFKDAKGHDSCIVTLVAMKAKVDNAADAGAHLEILPVSL